jgi:hypothetical protein
MKALFKAVALMTIVSATPAAAQSGSYYLDSRDPNNLFMAALGPGHWTIGVTGGGWSPWNYLTSCDANGANCHTGFHTIFYYTLNGGDLQHWGIDGAEQETETTSDFYATPQLALAHAFPPLDLWIDQPSTLRAFIPDCCYGDNTGGLTVTLTGPDQVVATPEPASLLLMATGLIAICLVAGRGRLALVQKAYRFAATLPSSTNTP